MTEMAWINAAITAARPQAIGALLRYFRDLDTAEEAFQDACLRALKNWPQNGPPRDPTAWLILVGRNAALDGVRKTARQQALPPEDQLSDLEDVEAPLAERLDGSHYRDDVLRLLFICCHPELPATQQIALALRIVSGLTVKQIARAFLVGEAAMEQRITRAKARIAKADTPFETPGPVERAERLAAVAAMVYLVFNEGYSAGDDAARAQLSEEAIRLARLLLRLFQTEPEIMGLAALLLLQHARAPARFDPQGEAVLLEDQDRSAWNAKLIAEGLALIDKAMRHNRPGPYQVQAEYLSVAEPGGLVTSIDNLLLFRCVQIVRRLAKQDRKIGIFCNISTASLADESFFPQFLELLTDNRDLAGALIFELGQSAFDARDSLVARNMAKLADLGFRFSLDKVVDLDLDLQDLTRSDVKFVKISAQLLLEELTEVEGRLVLRSMPDLAAEDFASLTRRYGVEVIVEKIESERQVVDVLELDIGYGQGHLFGEPRAIRDAVLAETDPPAGFVRQNLPRRAGGRG